MNAPISNAHTAVVITHTSPAIITMPANGVEQLHISPSYVMIKREEF
jgi:hypothetical protein